ncbi:MAG: HTH domain-containing protein [Clostridiaceae bacterium]
MGINYFTEEQQEELRKNPYIKKVSDKSITYTTDFRELFANEYRAGKTPSQILTECGINPRVLGKQRRDGIVARIKKFENRVAGFEDTRKGNSGRQITKDLTEAERISRLEHRIKYLEQENEFLKKIEFLDKKAEWKEKQKQRQKKNSNSSKK